MTDAQPISDEKLRQTFEREKPHRPNWPPTFEAAMKDPLISRVVALLARWKVPAVARRPWEPRHYGLTYDRGDNRVSPSLNGRGVPDSFKMRAAGDKPEKDDD